jgi:hypothetical protein
MQYHSFHQTEPFVDQLSFPDAEHNTKRKQTRREIFLEEMNRAVPWAQLESIIEPFYPTGRLNDSIWLRPAHVSSGTDT